MNINKDLPDLPIKIHELFGWWEKSRDGSLFVIPINRYLSGYQLELILKKHNQKELIVYIRIPKNYNSKLSDEIKKEFKKDIKRKERGEDYNLVNELIDEPVFGFIYFKLYDLKQLTENMNLPYYEVYGRLHDATNIKYINYFIYVELFYILSNDKDFKNFVNKEEKDIFKGLGKEIFCTGINYILLFDIFKIKSIDFRSIIVLLEAQSTLCDIDTFDPKMDLTQIVLYLFKNNKIDLSNYLNDVKYTINKEENDNLHFQEYNELKGILCNIYSNQKLIEYYKKEYKFKPLYTQQGYNTYMFSKFPDVYRSCLNNTVISRDIYNKAINLNIKNLKSESDTGSDT